MKKAIIVLGMHRSGTSATTGVLEKLGVDLGMELLAPSIENEKGYFENIKVLELNERILFENGSSYDDIEYKLLISDELSKTYILEAKKILEDEFSYSKIFAIKDPRLCLTFPIWEKALVEFGAEIEIILPWRNPFEVAKSLKRREGFSVEKSLLLWAKYFFLAEHQSRKYKRIFISFDTLVSDIKKSVKYLQDFIGFSGTIDHEALTFIEKRLKHQNISLQNIDDIIPNFLKKIIELMVKNELNEENEDIFNICREEYLASMKIFYADDILPNFKNYQSTKIENSDNDFESIINFNNEFYLKNNKDLIEVKIEPLEHFIDYGIKEGRFPNEYCQKNNIKIDDSLCLKEVFRYKYELEILSKNNQSLKIEHEQELQAKNEALENLQNSIKEKEESLISHSEEIESLKTQIDEVVEDLVSIKESKCWVYTKPLRDLQKVIRRDDV